MTIPRALYGSTSMRSIFPDSVDPAEVDSALQLLRRALRAERDLEPPGHERQRLLRFGADERLEVAPQRLVELAALHVGHVHAHARERIVEAGAHEAHRVLHALRLDPIGAELLRQPGEEAVQRRVRDAAAELGVDLGVDRLRIEEALDEPRGRAVGEPLELGDTERVASAEGLEHERMREPVRRVNAPRARSSRRSQPFARASEDASAGSLASSLATARRRSRSVLASSSGRVSADSGLRTVQRATSSASKTFRTSSQNGLGSRGEPSSVAASRTR